MHPAARSSSRTPRARASGAEPLASDRNPAYRLHVTTTAKWVWVVLLVLVVLVVLFLIGGWAS